jgi:replicative DNA helicase
MDQKLERKFLVHVVKDINIAQLAIQRKIDEGFFQWKTAGKLFGINNWFINQYGTSLTAVELVGLLQQSSTLDEDLQKSITVLFNELQFEVPDTDANFLMDQFFQYHKQALVEHALRRSVETLADKKIDTAVNVLKSDLANIDQKFQVEESRSGQLDVFAPRIHWEYDDRKINPKKYEGLKLGFSVMDQITGGLVPPSVSIIMAPPKEFKSALAMNICYNAAKRGIYSYYHANEGSVELFYMRFAAMELSIPLSHIKDNRMNPLEEARWLAFITSVEQGQHQILNKIYFDEVPMAISSPAFIANKIKKLKEEGKQVGLVVVDHFGRMTSTDKSQMQDWQRKGVIAQELCALALQERTPFILLTHVKSSSAKDSQEDNKDFDAYDIERSGQPLKDVDYVFSWRIENKETFDRNGKVGWAKLSLMLSRHSETGSTTLDIDGKYMQIREIAVGGSGNTTP